MFGPKNFRNWQGIDIASCGLLVVIVGNKWAIIHSYSSLS